MPVIGSDHPIFANVEAAVAHFGAILAERSGIGEGVGRPGVNLVWVISGCGWRATSAVLCPEYSLSVYWRDRYDNGREAAGEGDMDGRHRAVGDGDSDVEASIVRGNCAFLLDTNARPDRLRRPGWPEPPASL